jgi:hypothetical protein
MQTAAPDLSSNPDNLVPFLEVVASNQHANTALYPADFALIQRVNVCLATVGQKLVKPEPVMCAVLFQRCQYAFKTAAALALAGLVVEAFVMMRSCLEYAGYALAIFKDPTLQAVFANRHVTKVDMAKQKTAFRISEIKKVVESFDSELAKVFQTFYDRAVDFGGHPNPHATFSTMQMPDPNPDNTFTMSAMVTDAQSLRHAFKSVVQVGLTALFIFQHIWKAKFELLGVRAEMDRLRQENL